MPSTFTAIPNVGIKEEWSWKTDILRTINGTESRLSLRPRPRIRLIASFGPFKQNRYREFFEVLQANIKNVFATPIWPYHGPITQQTNSGNNRVYFDPALVPVAANGLLVLIKPYSGLAESHYVTTVHSDGATLATNVSQDITTAFIACLGMSAVINDGSGLGLQQITATGEVTFDSWVEPAVERPGSSASIDTFDSLPILDRRFGEGANFSFNFEKEIVDFDVGLRYLASRIKHAEIEATMEFIADRVLVPGDFDYWRKFFNTIKGSWKPFLLCTNLEDLTLSTALVQNGTTITFNEPAIEGEDQAFRRIQIEYSDGTTSQHVISNRTVIAGPAYRFDVSPNIPNDAKVANVSKISYLLKMRAADTVSINHGHLRSSISFDVRTTDNG